MRKRNQHARPKTQTPGRKPRKRLSMESLEQRSLLAADIGMADGYVQIHGAEQNDVVEVYQQDDQLVVNYREFDAGGAMLNQSQHEFTRTDVKGIFFHGGAGATLEMRVFSRPSLLRYFDAAGFVAVAEHCEDYEPYGILWPKRWSAPFVARRPL